MMWLAQVVYRNSLAIRSTLFHPVPEVSQSISTTFFDFIMFSFSSHFFAFLIIFIYSLLHFLHDWIIMAPIRDAR